MKTKVLKYNLVGRSQVFVVSLLALLRKTGLAGEETSGAIPAEVLDTLKIQLVSPNVTGAQILTTKLTRPCHYSVEGNELTIALGELTPGQHRLTVKSVYGTNTRSLLIIDATVPVGVGETGEAISVDVAAVSTVSDENNADGRVFQSDEEGNAKIASNTLSVGGGTATGENAVAEGDSTTASGDQSHAEGNNTTASGDQSHAEGKSTMAIGENSHAEGFALWGNPFEVTVRPLTAQEKAEITEKVGNVHPDYICEEDELEDGQAPVLYADEECTEMVARIRWSKYSSDWHDDLSGDFFQIMEGTLSAGTYWARFEPAASGYASHAEGNSTTASGDSSHAEGDCTTASGDRSHAEGESTTASGDQSHAEGYETTASGDRSHAEGYGTTASGYASHAEGNSTTASGDSSHAEGDCTTASGDRSHAEGFGTTASGDQSHAEGERTTASGYHSHAEGERTTASGYHSHAEGSSTTASGDRSHAEGKNTTASGYASHAEGFGTTASGYQSHAEGENTTASGDRSHTEGNNTTASGYASHAEGNSTTARGDHSHAEGKNTTASGYRSHAEGFGTIAASNDQHVSGHYNVVDNDGDYAFIVGNGTSDNARSNAFAIDWSGNLVLFNNGTPVVLTPAKLAQLIA